MATNDDDPTPPELDDDEDEDDVDGPASSSTPFGKYATILTRFLGFGTGASADEVSATGQVVALDDLSTALLHFLLHPEAVPDVRIRWRSRWSLIRGFEVSLETPYEAPAMLNEVSASSSPDAPGPPEELPEAKKRRPPGRNSETLPSTSSTIATLGERRITGESIHDVQTRIEAGLQYMTTPSKMSISILLSNPMFSHLSRDTIVRWAAEDKWVERRTQFFGSWQKAVAERFSGELANTYMEQLEKLKVVRDQAINHLSEGTLKPRSWEGVAKILLELDSRIVEISATLGEEYRPPQQDGKDMPLSVRTLAASANLPPEEARQAAAAILEARRKAAEAKAQAEQAAKAPTVTSDPSVMVIDVTPKK
jgi:hypothetical protein